MHVIILIAVIADDPECRIDADCPSMHACIGDRCQNPCRVNNPCLAGQECVVEDTLPVRTVACICPDGFYIGNNGECLQGILRLIQENLDVANNIKKPFKFRFKLRPIEIPN